MIIQKFGGTSVGTAERMKSVARLINDKKEKIVVLSALSGTTNSLVETGQALYNQETEKALKISAELENHYERFIEDLFSSAKAKKLGTRLVKTHFDFIKGLAKDLFNITREKQLLSQGELISTGLFQIYLEEQKIPSVLVPALHFMRVDKDGDPDYFYIQQNLKNELKNHSDKKLFITQGFICRNAYGEIDNLKRGGSDFSASIIGNAANATEIQIWTDIDGMHNNDPRLVKKTFPIAELSFDEAAELAYFGAKILHPSSIQPAKIKNIPVWLKNTMQPEAHGTLITTRSKRGNIKAIAAKDGITAIKIKSGRMLLAYGFLRSVFEVFERYRTPIDMITTSEVAVSVTIDDQSQIKKITEELKNFGTVEVDSGLSIICIVGDFLAEKTGYAVKIFSALNNIPVRMISYGGSENNISLLVLSKHKQEALAALNEGLFMNN